MGLPKFIHYTPSTLKEALHFLKETDKKTSLLAGGTDLIGTIVPEVLINLKGIGELYSIRNNQKGGIIIGALTTLETILESDMIRQNFNLLSQSAEKVASTQIRNVATIGGNICLNTRCWYYNQSENWRRSIPRCFKLGGDRCLVMKKSKECNAVFVADTVPALIALGAKLKIVIEGKEKMIPIEKFYSGKGHPPNILKEEEILTEIHIPKVSSNTFGIFLKFSPREVLDFAFVNLAILVTFKKENSLCKDAKIVVGGVNSFPVRSLNGESLLKGEKITEKLIEKVGNSVLKDSEPISPIWTSPYTRREIIKTFVKRGLERALEFSQKI